MIVKAIDNVTLGAGGWSVSCDETGKITLVKNIIGSPSAVRTAFESHINATGAVLTVSDTASPLQGRFFASGGSIQHVDELSARATLNYSTQAGGTIAEDGLTADNTHFETADFQNIEKEIRSAPFWVNAFSSDSEYLAIAQERIAWKCVQNYLDATGDISEVESKLEEDLGASGLSEDQKNAVRKMISKRLAGIEAYYYPAPTLQVTDILSTMPTNFGANVGKVTEPQGFTKITIPSGYKWLKMSDTLTFDGGTYRREVSYVGANFWDKDLYS